MPDARFGNPGSPGSAQESQFRRDHLVWITLNCGVRLYVNKAVAHLFKGFWDELEATTGYSLADHGQPDDWGFANRANRNNPSVKSNHSYGLATDGNSEENPNTHDGKVHTNMPIDATHKLAKKWGLRWGADYTGNTKDPMHVEYIDSYDNIKNYPLGGVTSAKPVTTTTTTELPQEEDDMDYIALPVDEQGNTHWQEDGEYLGKQHKKGDAVGPQAYIGATYWMALFPGEPEALVRDGYVTKKVHPFTALAIIVRPEQKR